MPDAPSRMSFQAANAYEAQHAARLRTELNQQAQEVRPMGETELEQQYHSEAASLDKDDVVTSAAIQSLARENGWSTEKVGRILAAHNQDGDGLFSESEFDAMMGEAQAGEDRGLLDALYQEHLGREPDATGLETWGAKITELRAEGKSESEIKEALTPYITGSPEYQALHAPPAAAAPTSQAPATDAPAGTPAVTPASGTAAGQAAYINQYRPDGADGNYWNGPSNCGPTSMAMIARAHGFGEGMTDAQLINHLGSAGGTGEAGTGWAGISAMGQAMGLPVEQNPGDPAWIAAQLQAGKMVVANGDYYAMPPHDAAKTGQGGHYVTIVGMDANGNFLVNDPADSSLQATPFTPAQMTHYLRSNSNHGGQAFAVG